MIDEGFRKVLIIAYYFPPMGLSGVQRTLKFAKYLSRYGWKPTVLTVEPGGYFAFDETLLEEAQKAEIEIVRTKSRDINFLFGKKRTVKMPSEIARRAIQFFCDWFFIPDTKIFWKRKAIKTAIKLHHNKKFDLIFATAPPQTDFLIGAVLKRKLNIPLVIDYRDGWLDYPFKYFPTPIHRFLNKQLEKKVLKVTDKVIVTHRRVKEGILKRYRSIDYNEVTILPQGFDPEDFPQLTNKKEQSSSKMRITHAGTFYANRTPRIFLQALASLLKDNPKMKYRIEVNFVGNVRKEDQKLVKRLHLDNVVNFLGYLPHKECVNQIINSDVLWFVIDNDYQTPGKLYEYFGARKPILASVVNGYTERLIKEAVATKCVALDDVEAHKKALIEFFSDYEEGKLPKIPVDFSSRFDRVILTGELAKLFESLMDYDHGSFVKLEEKSK